MPAAEVLLDSNVLLYALSGAPEERPKRECAAGIIAHENFGTSYQILMETWVVATRKMARPIKEARVAAFLERILVFPCVPGTPTKLHQVRHPPINACSKCASVEAQLLRVISNDKTGRHDQLDSCR